jgi:hypothetical protein
MSPVEHSARTAHVRALRAAIEVAVKRACVTLDLTPSAATDHLISEACRDVAQLHAKRSDLDIDPDLNTQEKTT